MSLRVVQHSIDQETRSLISTRYNRITRAVNKAFWNSDSDTAHSMYVGSYGRGTAIDTSDLDVLIELPGTEFDHFTSLNGNGPSRLLQAVKDAILDTYPRSSVKGDGQVVVITFSDSMVFEILPAFRNETIWGWDGTYKYPDTHMGGNWLSTNPRAEIDAMAKKDSYSESNKLLTATCQHIRYVRDANYSSFHLSGILIDSFVYAVIGGWHFLREGEDRSLGTETYEEYLLRKYNELSWNGIIAPTLYAPGSNMVVRTDNDWTVLGKVLKCLA